MTPLPLAGTRRLSAPLPVRGLHGLLVPVTAANARRARAWLSQRERARARRFRTRSRRQAFEIGCGTLRWLLSELTSLPPGRVPLQVRSRRRPLHRHPQASARFSLSVAHTDRWVAVAALRTTHRQRRLGVDLEPWDRTPGAGARRRMTRVGFADSVGTRSWTRLEAAVKADGRGLAVVDATRLVSESGRCSRLLTDRPPRHEIRSWTLDPAGIPGLLLALAVAVPADQDPMR